jgi:[acyl-carrier-protein] S-malonyltransferase
MINQTLALVFPGQGSQSVGMLSEIVAQYPNTQSIFAEASAVLGYDLWAMIATGTEAEINNTVHTQPALLAASFAIWQIVRGNTAIAPVILAGHSLGEYTALLCAGAISFQDAIKLVAARGQYMQDAVSYGTGAMGAIIGLPEETVAAVCKDALTSSEQVVSPANFNSLGQVVIAGHKESVERALLLAKERGAKLVTLIPVSVPSHCELMMPAAKRLAELLNTIDIKMPTIPVISNVDVSVYTSQDAIRKGLIRQLYNPVRWVETIQYFVNHGISQVIECGPGKILTGLNKRIDKNLQLMTTSDLVGLNAVLSHS